MFLLIFILGLLFPVSVQAATYYVSTTGNDANPGTILDAPLKTFAKAVSLLVPGDQLLLFSGNYQQKLYINKSGTAASPITIQPVTGQQASIDGGTGTSAVIDIPGSYIHLENLEIKNGRGLDCVLTKGTGVEMRRLNVHHCWNFGIRLGGLNGLVEDSVVFDNVQENAGGTNTSGGWDSGFKLSQGASGNIIRNNRVFHNWGEGIALTMSGAAVITNNTVYDNYSVNIYIDNSFDVDVTKNLTYSIDPVYFRYLNGAKRPANCITMGEENYEGWENKLRNIRIINNIMYGCRNGTGYTYAESSLGGMDTATIAYNTIINTSEYGLRIIKPSGTTKTRNSIVANNIIDKGTDIDVTGGVTFNNNLWVRPPEAIAQGPGDKIGDPQFIASPGVSLESYRLSGLSPAINAGVAMSGITDDIENRLRDSRPDIGAMEFTGNAASASPSPSPKPGDANGDGKVDGVDYIVWLTHYRQTGCNSATCGDFNNDDKVDGIDYVVWLNNYGQ